MGNFGFSYVGLIFLVLLFVPNVIWAGRVPEGYAALSASENRVLVALERVGQAAVTCCALIFSDFNPHALSLWSLWLAACVVLMALYEAAWIRYFRAPSLGTFYAGFLGIPCPLAVLPVAAALCLGVYGRVVWMIVSAALLGVGHIGIHAGHMRALAREQRAGPPAD